MVESIAFDNGLQRSTEQSTTGTVVTDNIISKVNFRTPFQVFNTETFFSIDSSIQWLYKRNLEFLRAMKGFFIKRNNLCHFVLFIKDFHGLGTHKLHLVTLSTPIETISLRMHVPSYNGLVIQFLHNLQIGTMHIDCIVHHAFIKAIARNNLSFATREMGCIGLSGEITRVIITTETNIKFFQSDIFADLCQQAHTFGIVYIDILQTGILIQRKEYAWSRPFVITHCYLCTRHQTRVFPMWSAESLFIQLFCIIGRTPKVAGLVYHMTCLSIECNTSLRIILPSFAITFKVSVLANTGLYPWFDTEYHTVFGIIHNLYLTDMRLCKIDAEILQSTIFRSNQGKWKHASIEIKIGTSSIKRQILPVFQSNTNGLRIGLVMVRDIILLLKSTFGMEIITSGFKNQSYLLSFILLLDSRQCFLHFGRNILFRIRQNTIITHPNDFLIGATTHQKNKQA